MRSVVGWWRGECDRNRNFAADFEIMDMMDGDLDGTLDY